MNSSILRILIQTAAIHFRTYAIEHRIIDNARFYQSAQTREIIANAQCQLIFLPPLIFLPLYSPDLNPIEKWWAVIKARVKKIVKQFDDFNQALDHVLTVY